MQRILVFGTSRVNVNSVCRGLETNSPFEVLAASSARELAKQLLGSNFNLLIISVKEFNKEHNRLLIELRDEGYFFPILVVASSYKSRLGILSMAGMNVNYVHGPLEDKALAGVVRKLIIAKSVPQQKFQRYPTNQRANIETLAEGASQDSNVFNLSQGGAYCEFDSEFALSIGDMIRITIKLEDVEAFHVMNAKVVWTTHQGSPAGKRGAGLKFVSSHDAYKNMMDKL